MKVIDLKTKKTLDVGDAYGHRLIEQGKAVASPTEKIPPAPTEKPAPAPAEKPTNKKGAKGEDA